MIFDHRKLTGRIIEKFETRNAFAYRMGISQTTLYNKLTGRTEFTSDEIRKACALLDIPPEDVYQFFFTHQV